MDVFTLERAEVLRGPSAVLYGAGGAGGLFNAVSKTPRPTLGGELGAIIGTDDTRQFQADVTDGLTDTISGRFVGLIRDGNLQWKPEKNDRKLAMPSLAWSPDDDTKVTLIGLYQKDNEGTQTYLPLSRSGAADKADRLPFNFFVGEPDFNRMNTEYSSATLMLDHRFSDTLKFASHVRYYKEDVDYGEVYGDYSDGTSPFEDDDETLLEREFYVLAGTYKGLNWDTNLLWDFNTGSIHHKLLGGVDYTLFKNDMREGYSCDGYAGVGYCYDADSPPALDLNDPVYGQDFDWGYTHDYTTRSTQLGFYLQDQIKLMQRLNMLLGVRHDKTTDKDSGVGQPDNTATTYRVGMIGDIGWGLSPYLSYSESFLPIFGGNAYGEPYKPKRGRQYEGGFKWQPEADTLVTFSVFNIHETNYLTADPENLQNFLQAGQVGSKGAEIEGKTRLLGLDLSAAYSYTDATILKNNDGTEGNRVADMPKNLASAWVGKSFPVGDALSARVGGGVRYIGNKVDTYDRYTTPSVTLADAMASLDWQQWQLSVNASNLFDKHYYSFCSEDSPPDGACYLAKDRTVMTSLHYHF